MVISLSP